jgi:hypothetical protein
MFVVVVALGLLSGCFKHTYTYGAGGNTGAPPKPDDAFVSHYLAGLIGEEVVDVKSICPSGNATVKDYQSFLNGLICALIGIIWYPSTIEVYCDKGETAVLTITPEQMRAMVKDPRVVQLLRESAPADSDRLAAAMAINQLVPRFGVFDHIEGAEMRGRQGTPK